MVGKPILNGRDSVRKVLDTFMDRGGRWAEYAAKYHGPVIDLFDCDESMYTAVEVTAGNRCVAGGWRGSRSWCHQGDRSRRCVTRNLPIFGARTVGGLTCS